MGRMRKVVSRVAEPCGVNRNSSEHILHELLECGHKYDVAHSLLSTYIPKSRYCGHCSPDEELESLKKLPVKTDAVRKRIKALYKAKHRNDARAERDGT